jgi:3-oxoadipate enol-lactonase
LSSSIKIGPNWIEKNGQGVPVVLISGLGYATWCWSEVVKTLSKTFHTISLDNRGAGRSDFPQGPISIKMMADDVARIISECALESVHVVGHSMGGYIALTLAKDHPDLVLSLALVCTAAGGASCVPVPESTLERWHEAAPLPPQEFARRTMPLSFAPGWVDSHPDAFENYLIARLKFPTPPLAWAAQFAACEDYLSTEFPVEELFHPSLVIHGVADKVVPFVNGQSLAHRLPKGRLLTYRDGGHLCFLEASAHFCEQLIQFFQAQTPNRGV